MNGWLQKLVDAHAVRAVARVWKGLLIFALAMSAIVAVAAAPLVVTLSYRLIELSGEPVLGNTELARFLLSPRGVAALVLLTGTTLTLWFVEYAGLILLAGTALRGQVLRVRDVVAALLATAPRLFALAVLFAGAAILVALPFLGLAAAGYWLLLSADINFYLEARPPRFWLAAAIAGALAIGLLTAWAWLFLRWALAVPCCVLDRQGWRAALATSARRMRGRKLRLIASIIAWQLIHAAVVAALVAMLDWLNPRILGMFEGRLPVLVWSTVFWIFVEAAVLQVAAAAFAIGVSAILAAEYERARHESDITTAASSAQLQPGPWPAWITRLVIVVLLLAGPLATLFYGAYLAGQFVERRPARVTAHRAGSRNAAENSLEALHLALEAGADYCEVDVQLTADRQVVLVHDRDLKRVTGDPRDVVDVTLAELAPLRLIDRGRVTDNHVPTLAEFIEACGDRLRLNIELKDFGRAAGLGQAVVDVLREKQFTHRAATSSFELRQLAEVRSGDARIPVGVILSAVQGDVTKLPVNFLSLNQRLVTAGLVRRAHAANMEVHAWTVNDRETAWRMLDLGCDNLITSDPALIRAAVDAYASLDEVQRMLLRLRRWLRE